MGDPAGEKQRGCSLGQIRRIESRRGEVVPDMIQGHDDDDQATQHVHRAQTFAASAGRRGARRCRSTDVGQSRRCSRSSNVRDGFVMELFRRRELIGRNSAYTLEVLPPLPARAKEKLHNECRCGACFHHRDGGIRTRDPLNPIQVRYRAALRPVKSSVSLSISRLTSVTFCSRNPNSPGCGSLSRPRAKRGGGIPSTTTTS